MQKQADKDSRQEDSQEDTYDLDESATIKAEVDDKIDDWKATSRHLNIEPKATLYKYEDPKRGNDYTFAGYWTGDEIPDRHNIGLKFGSGRFFIVLNRPKGNGKEKTNLGIVFRIHPIYDEYKKKTDEENRRKEMQALTGGNGAAPAPNQSGAESFLMVKDILGLLLPVIREAGRQNNAQAAAPAKTQESPQDLFSSYAMMQKILKNNLMDTAATFQEFSRKYAALEDQRGQSIDQDEDEPEEKEAGLLEKIINMIEPFFGIIAQKTAAGRMAAAGLKAAPQFAEILQDSRLCSLIIQYFDRTKGRKLADIALNNIGIDRETIFRQLPQAAAIRAPIRTQAPGQTPGQAPGHPQAQATRPAAPKPRQTAGKAARTA